MIKKAGDKKVDDYKHYKSGVECAIYLRYTTFVATLLERAFEAPDIAILRRQLDDYAEAWVTIEWHPLLEVEIENDAGGRYRDSCDGEAIKFNRRRFFVGTSPAGEIFKVDWDIDERHRKAKMESLGGGYSRSERLRDELKLTGLPLGAPLKRCDGHYFIDYTEELWQRSEGIVRGIVELRRMIASLYSSKEGIAHLLTGGGERIMLQAPAKPEPPKGKGKK